MTILVTGAAGFIGYHFCERLLLEKRRVIGIDNLCDYYDPALKKARLERLQKHKNFSFQHLDLADRVGMASLFNQGDISAVVHFGAQAGVRHSLSNPHVYAASNVTGFLHVLEGCREAQVKHLIYASTSSVYGLNQTMPFSEHSHADHPMTFYAATKRANELMAHSYSHLFNIPSTGLRFFTVYGPWGRPDMALFKFTKAILAGEPIEVYNNGKMVRDFTYIADVVESVYRLLECPPKISDTWNPRFPDPATSSAPWRIYNVGNNQPVELMTYVQAIERAVGKSAVIQYKPLQPGDVLATQADCKDLETITQFRPSTPVADGVQRFVEWYKEYYKA